MNCITETRLHTGCLELHESYLWRNELEAVLYHINCTLCLGVRCKRLLILACTAPGISLADPLLRITEHYNSQLAFLVSVRIFIVSQEKIIYKKDSIKLWYRMCLYIGLEFICGGIVPYILSQMCHFCILFLQAKYFLIPFAANVKNPSCSIFINCIQSL